MKTKILSLILITLACGVSSARNLTADESRKSYLGLCNEIPALKNKKGRSAYCECMADGYKTKKITADDLQRLRSLYLDPSSPQNDTQRSNLLFSYDMERSEDVCMKHLK